MAVADGSRKLRAGVGIHVECSRCAVGDFRIPVGRNGEFACFRN
jgi:hypothetical protein